MAAATRSEVLSLYRLLLRAGRQFTDYNYRNYALRRARDAFHENKTVADKQKIQDLVNEAKKNLEIIKRQVIIGQMYGHGKLIIESQEKVQDVR
ncbi:LYR motif-containing protein 4-like [Gigantopelta aegis]|uniref:LYR motif-containing protein 4-like n=1 Tax=Gigantopelta aegis TaxID=1735272 RepID=UPI001B88CBDA|nr:LYR motif-containing protein 4-like [Gigantopelta aegis]